MQKEIPLTHKATTEPNTSPLSMFLFLFPRLKYKIIVKTMVRWEAGNQKCFYFLHEGGKIIINVRILSLGGKI